MENFTKDKLSIIEKIFSLLEKRFVTGTSSFIFGGVVVIIFLHFFVIPDKNEVIESKNKIIEDKEKRIYDLENDIELWKDLYLNSPNNMKKIYDLFEGMKENKLSTLHEQSDISDELKKTQRVIDKNNKEISNLKKELK